MVGLKIHNDGKQRWQSYEVWIDGIDCEHGYGANEQEALVNYKLILCNWANRITIAAQDLELENFKTVPVDCAGNEI